MRFARKRLLAIFVSVLSLLANGNVFACFAEMAGNIVTADCADMESGSDKDRTVWEMSTARTPAHVAKVSNPPKFDCCSQGDHFLPKISSGKSETQIKTAVPPFFAQTEEVRPEVSIGRLFSRPPPDPPNGQSYASLIGIVKKLN